MTEKNPQPRTFASLRVRARTDTIDQKILNAAALKIFSSPEGEVLFGWMLKEVDVVMPSDAPDGALRELNGARRLLAKIEALVANARKDNHTS